MPRGHLRDDDEASNLGVGREFMARLHYNLHRRCKVVHTVRALVDENGNVRLLEKVALSGPTQAYVLILEEDSETSPKETLLLSEAALSQDWARPEEDAAWSFLQPAQ
jgi:hypothetical protein